VSKFMDPNGFARGMRERALEELAHSAVSVNSHTLSDALSVSVRLALALIEGEGFRASVEVLRAVLRCTLLRCTALCELHCMHSTVLYSYCTGLYCAVRTTLHCA
jgi:hypothetical protein